MKVTNKKKLHKKKTINTRNSCLQQSLSEKLIDTRNLINTIQQQIEYEKSSKVQSTSVLCTAHTCN